MRRLACGLLAVSLVAAPVAAQDTGTARTGSGTLTVRAGADVPLLTGYVFRGLIQEFKPKVTIQPFLDLAIAVSDRTLVNVGVWNSVHTGTIKETVGAYYAADFYTSATFVTGKWRPGVAYRLYTSPAGGYDQVEDDGVVGMSELAFFASYDDRGRSLPWSPRFLIALETTDAQADFGTKSGMYVEAGVRPTFRLSRLSSMTLAVPVTAGASLKDYYEIGGDNGRLGFLQAGAEASVPLAMFKPGIWEAHAGIDVFLLAPHLRFALDDGPRAVRPVLRLGFSATF